MAEPRLRTVNKATAPFDVNKFPVSLVHTLAQNVVYMMATKQSMSLEGNEWEQIFAECVGADWKPSNVGLDDVVLDNCCWGAKTVFGQTDIEHQNKVRLICGRNAVTYSFGVDNYSEVDPNKLGEMVLQIWNERVSAVRQVFKFVRTVVLVKSKDYKDYLVFEFDTVRYDPELYFNPKAMPIYMKQPVSLPSETTFIKRTRETDSPLQRMAPGYENYEALSVLHSTGRSKNWTDIGRETICNRY